mgnify:CR=1 FL=1
MTMRKIIKLKKWEYEEIVKILEKILGYCGIWHEDDIISVSSPTGHEVSMTIKTFLEQLKRECGLEEGVKKVVENKIIKKL